MQFDGVTILRQYQRHVALAVRDITIVKASNLQRGYMHMIVHFNIADRLFRGLIFPAVLLSGILCTPVAQAGTHTFIQAPNLPVSGPYSQAVRAGDLLFISGIIAFDPAKKALVPPQIALQTKQVLSNLDAVLRAAGMTKADVVKTTVLLKDISDMPIMNRLYGAYFTKNRPARTTASVNWGNTGILIEIDAIAMCKENCARAGK